MEGYVWPQVPPEENPISYVTNGVHVPTFLAREWISLFDMRFGGEWRNELTSEEYWNRIDEIPDYSFWSLRQSLKSELQADAHDRAMRTLGGLRRSHTCIQNNSSPDDRTAATARNSSAGALDTGHFC